jgi:predicted kinase
MNRQKIIVLQGVPASGKSTWAKEYVKDKPDWVIVNRDSIIEATGQY